MQKQKIFYFDVFAMRKDLTFLVNVTSIPKFVNFLFWPKKGNQDNLIKPTQSSL